MLDAYVIDEIKRREQGRGREHDKRPTAEIPPPGPPAPPPEKQPGGSDGDRGVVIIDYA
jgi:hypothetical protein